jgi:hypothetical protein
MTGSEPIVDNRDELVTVISEPLRTAATGQEAVRDMLRRVLSAGLSISPRPNAPRVFHFDVEMDSTRPMGHEWRHQLRTELVTRLEHSVSEGELRESADVQVLSCLCMSFASGLAVSLQDGISKACLEGSIPLFLESVGFHKIRAPKRRSRGSSPVGTRMLTLVKR